ncbi:hypothetical protein [Microcoleus sp. B9-D4]|uniref:hypothetical protein n=1 Tax=Microcoleus sp. B9-D4 TaxID=2818711 RepID=UPI002FD7768D
MSYSVLFERTLAISLVEFIPWRTDGRTEKLGGLTAKFDANGQCRFSTYLGTNQSTLILDH